MYETEVKVKSKASEVTGGRWLLAMSHLQEDEGDLYKSGQDSEPPGHSLRTSFTLPTLGALGLLLADFPVLCFFWLTEDKLIFISLH